jgi:sirohydrochlorin ferrochelatase
MRTPLVAVAHGSRDPRSAATVRALVDLVAAQRPDLDVRVAFLDLSRPLLSDVLAGLRREGHRDAVVVPLLLGSAYHARVDIPSIVAGEPGLAVRVTDVLGADPEVQALAVRRLLATGVRTGDAGLGVVLAATGSSSARANRVVSAMATRWAARYGWAGVLPAFASMGEPDVSGAIDRLRADGATRVAVASWFLAPGRLPDRVAAQTGDVVVAAPLGADPALARLVLRRYLDVAMSTRSAA